YVPGVRSAHKMAVALPRGVVLDAGMGGWPMLDFLEPTPEALLSNLILGTFAREQLQLTNTTQNEFFGVAGYVEGRRFSRSMRNVRPREVFILDAGDGAVTGEDRDFKGQGSNPVPEFQRRLCSQVGKPKIGRASC